MADCRHSEPVIRGVPGLSILGLGGNETTSQAIGARLTAVSPPPRLVLLDWGGTVGLIPAPIHCRSFGSPQSLSRSHRLAAFEAIVDELAAVAVVLFAIAMEPPPSGKRLENSRVLSSSTRTAARARLGSVQRVGYPQSSTAGLSVVLPAMPSRPHWRTAVPFTTGIAVCGAPAYPRRCSEVVEPELRLRLIALLAPEGEKLNYLVASAKGAQDGQAATKKRSDVMIKDKAILNCSRTASHASDPGAEARVRV